MAAPSKLATAFSEPLPRLLTDLAAEPAIRAALQWFTREKQWINEQQLQLCRIAAPTFFEQPRAEWMLAQFRALGLIARIDRAGNVIAHPVENREGPYIALTAHLDTVLAPRKLDEVSLGPDGRLHGPGVSDNGAGLTALLALARVISSLDDKQIFHRVVFIANVGEEGEGNLSGMRYLCRQSNTGARIHAFLVLDGPNTDHITSQALASRRFDVSITGPGGHSWSDYGLANPVHALSRAITHFTEHRFGANGSPRSSYNFGILEGGSSINSIPTLARTKVDIRSESSAKLEEISALLTTCVERALEFENDRATGGKVAAKIKEIGSRPGGRLPEDARILQYIRAVDAHLGIRSHLDCASTDANIPLSIGLPAISIGAGGQGGGAHTPQEWFHPEGRELGLRRILLTLLLLLRDLNTTHPESSRAAGKSSRNGG
ncbi:MAG TPA: M20/M25/M40 family metallo-hydrolase [Bryobacteraceae bacterium]|nr:M20/M25/M40 family metallo-hydrolase [Bryobacteraceae bacterium]